MFEMMDDQMKEAYLKGELKFSKGKIILPDQEISIIEMNRGEVLSSNFTRLFDLIKENGRKERNGFASIYLGIKGWDDTPEPIYEIMEIRRFYSKLFRKMPYFLFYLSPIGQIPYYILACLADIEVKARVGPFVSPQEMLKKEGSTKNIGSTTIEVMLSSEIGYKMIESIQEHVKNIGFVDENEELPIIYRLIEKSIKADERQNRYI